MTLLVSASADDISRSCACAPIFAPTGPSFAPNGERQAADRGPGAKAGEPALDQAMRSLHRAIERFEGEAAAKLGIGRSDWRALCLVIDNGGLAPRALGAALGLTSGSVTTLLDRLEGRGLVRRMPHPTDRRSLSLEATARARETIEASREPLAAIGLAIAGKLGTERARAAAKQLNDFARLVDFARGKRP